VSSPIFPGLERKPRIAQSVYIAPTATVIGDVTVGENASIWFNAVVRGDVNWIRIGSDTNIQDGSNLHVTYETHPLVIGDRVAVGHGCVLHGCTIADDCLIGIGAIVLDGARVGAGSIVGAGSVVTEGADIPPGHLVLGVPGKVVRPVLTRETQRLSQIVTRYIRIKNIYKDQLNTGVD
jgi:carbonic anhydrase/acetyltransferase-like protein (isoleucine patch superfamily)